MSVETCINHSLVPRPSSRMQNKQKVYFARERREGWEQCILLFIQAGAQDVINNLSYVKIGNYYSASLVTSKQVKMNFTFHARLKSSQIDY